MKKRDAEKALIAQGVKKGVLTFDEISEIFPAEHFPVEEMERLLSCLDAQGVQVVERENRKSLPARQKQKG